MNISFGAKLVINKNFPSKLPKNVQREEGLKIMEEFANFLETPVVKALTEHDVVEITEESKLGRYNLYMDCYNDETETRRVFPMSMPTKAFDRKFYERCLKLNIKFFIAQKSGCKQRYLEGTKDYINRGIMEYTRQYLEKKRTISDNL